MKSLISCALIFVVSLAFGGATYRDCFEIVPGDIPHIAYSRNKAVDFSVDCIGESGWVVSEHCQRGISTAFMQDFAALPPGTEVRVQIPNAQPGLLYAVGASATLDGLGNAVRDAQKVEATSEGVELTVVKPAGDSCFFRMAVEQP